MPGWEVRFDLALDLSSLELVRLVAQADALARVIRGIPIPPRVRMRLDNLNILRAVRGTTGIEGSDLSEEEVERVLSSDKIPALDRPRAREEQEVRNAAAVMRYISTSLRENPDLLLSEQIISKIHRLTTENIEYVHNTPGVYRSHGVEVGGYAPPRDHDAIVDLMKRFIQWLHSPQTVSWPPVVRAIAAHFYFISIHPFGDGNGRTARAIEGFLLYQAKVNVLGFYSLSNFYYRHRPEYIQALDDARFRSHDNLTPFVCFALQGYVAELESIHKEVLNAVAEIAFRDLAHQELLLHDKLGRKVGERMYHLLLGLWEPVRLREIRDGSHPLSVLYRDVTSKTLSRDIKFLKQHGLIVVEDDRIRANLGLMTNFMS